MIYAVVFLTAVVNLIAGYFIAVYLGYGPRWGGSGATALTGRDDVQAGKAPTGSVAPHDESSAESADSSRVPDAGEDAPEPIAAGQH